MDQQASDEWLDAAEWGNRARRLGPLRYSDLGRRRLPRIDPETVDALGAWLAGQLDRWWHDQGEPDPFTAVVVSGDRGELARSLLQWGPECLLALRYVIVDPDGRYPEEPRVGAPGGRAKPQGYGASSPSASVVASVSLEEPAFLYPTRSVSGPGHSAEFDDDAYDPDDDPAPPARRVGPLVTYLTDVPVVAEASQGAVVVALRWLSRLPYDLFQPGPAGWSEVRVESSGTGLQEVMVPAPEGDPLPARPASGPERWRYQRGARDWLRQALAVPRSGRLVVADDATLDFGQLYEVARPLEEAQPVDGAGAASLSATTWRLG